MRPKCIEYAWSVMELITNNAVTTDEYSIGTHEQNEKKKSVCPVDAESEQHPMYQQ